MEGIVRKSGSRRQLRFGSQVFASQGLSSSQQQALADACRQQGNDKVISVLVETAAHIHTSSSTSSSGNITQSPSGQHSSPSASAQPSTAGKSESTQSSEARTSQQASSSDSDDAENQIWVFAFEDTVHDRSAAAVKALREGSWRGRGHKDERLRVMMLTGDNEASAQRMGKQLQIDDVRAGLSPEQKLQVDTSLYLHETCVAALVCLQRLSRHWHADYRTALMHGTYPSLHLLTQSCLAW